MEYRQFGRTGLKVSVIGFGGIPIQRVSGDEAVTLLRAAQEQGINFIDTAQGYASSESKIGYALQQVPGEWIIASKSMKRDAIGFRAELVKSLTALGVESIDLYQFHNVSTYELYDQVMGEGGAYEAALKAQEEGLIKHIGISSHKNFIAKKAVESGKFVSVQVPFNAVEDQFKEVIEMAAKRDVAIIIMKPLAGGALDNGNLALRYICEYPVTVIIPGMQKVEEVIENAAVGNHFEPLNPDERTELSRIASELGTTFCRRCEYCSPCPEGINIPTMFIFDGYYSRYNLQDWATERYWSQQKTAHDCVKCGICETRCPYNLPIRDMLDQVASHFERRNK